MAILQPVQHNIFTSGFADLMDVVGVNYRESELINAHRQHPDYKILGTENRIHPKSGRPPRQPRLRRPVPLDRDRLPGRGRRLAANRVRLRADRSQRVDQARRLSEGQLVVESPHGLHCPRRWWRRGKGKTGGKAAGGGNVEVCSNCQSVELFLDGKSLGQRPSRPTTGHVPGPSRARVRLRPSAATTANRSPPANFIPSALPPSSRSRPQRPF